VKKDDLDLAPGFGQTPPLMKTRSFLLSLPLVAVVALSVFGKETTASKTSVKPGINDNFLDPELKVDDWLKRFEVESREVFQEREAVLKACGVEKGMVVADIGAGTGLYTRLFSKAVGPDGWVAAVDISGPMLKHIVARAEQEGQDNITAILSPEDSTSLPPDTLDLAFICDTYHHFEYPADTLNSLVRAIKKGGSVVVIDFERIEGVSREWLLGHVRAGKEVFRKEIEDAGLTFVEEVKIPGFKENYFLRFRKN
jgi:ubiquinone/menaquinone biosynthesis C-methylase UbiE